jgi:regulator of sigma E protease
MFGNTPSNLLAFVIVLGFLIFAHESGHFFVAKFFKVRVLVFSFGFGKRLFGFKRGDTDYRVSLLPLGGYVRMAGDTPEESQKNDPAEFLSKPKWQRLLILVAGPAMNLVLAVLFLAIVNMAGIEITAIRPIIGKVTPGEAAARGGLQAFDRIVTVDDEKITGWQDVQLAIQMHPGQPLHIGYLRNEVRGNLTVTPDKVDTEHGAIGRIGVQPFIDPVLQHTEPSGLVVRAGLRDGDRIVSAGGVPVRQLLDFITAIEAMPPHAVDVVAQRGNQQVHASIMSGKDVPDHLGIGSPTELRKFGFAAAFNDSVERNMKSVRYMFVSLGRLFQDRSGVKQMAGPVTIARLSGEFLRLGWRQLFEFMAIISLNLGILNLLPIPVLDGGHIAFLLIESVARRDLPTQSKERALQFGFVLLALFMIIVLYFDVVTNIKSVMKG